MFLVFVIALLVVGPERLPGLARKIGAFIQKARTTFQQVSQEVQMELDTEELNRKLEQNNILPETEDIKSEFQEIKKELEKPQDTKKKP